MSVPIVTIDTSVIVSALRSSLGASYRLLELIGEGKFEIGLTAPLVFEYESVCKRMVQPTVITADDIDILIDYLCSVGKLSVVYFNTRPSVADPDDEMVLEAAVASGSDWLITHNVRDLVAGASRFGVEVITPGKALRRLGIQP